MRTVGLLYALLPSTNCGNDISCSRAASVHSHVHASALVALATSDTEACRAERVGSCAGTVEAVGDGRVGERTQEFQLKAGDTIVYSKFGIGATDLEVQGEQYVLIREDDCIGTMPRSGATAADVPELKPIGDRVLLKVGTTCSHLETQALLSRG